MASTVLGTSMTFPSAQLAVSSSPFSQMMMGLPSLGERITSLIGSRLKPRLKGLARSTRIEPKQVSPR